MLEVSVRPIRGTRTKERTILWEATAYIDKTMFSAQSRSNPISDLFRKMVDAGVPDQDVATFGEDGRVELRYGSFYAAAKRMLSETPTKPLGEGKYRAVSF